MCRTSSQNSGTIGRADQARDLLPNTKIAEDMVEDIVRVDVAKDRPQLVQCGADFH